MSDQTDFAPLGEMELENAGSLFQQCEFIRKTASDSGLIIMQWAGDVQFALAQVPVVDPGGWHGIGALSAARRARRVSRHCFRAAEALKAAAESASKVRPAYLQAFSNEIQMRRRRGAFDPRGGL